MHSREPVLNVQKMHSREPVPSVQKGDEMLKLRIDLKIIAVIIIFLFTGQLKGYCIIMFFCFLHELGHIIAAKFFKMKVEKVEILPCGFSSSFFLCNSPEFFQNFSMQELVVAMAGPIVSLILALSFQYIDDINFSLVNKQEIVYSNILILIFNLLPLYPLDGGRILKCILNINLKEQNAENIINKVSSTAIILLTIVSSIAVYYFKNIAIFLICIFLWSIILKNKFSPNFKLNKKSMKSE